MPVALSRWVRKDARVYDFSDCKLCGSCWGICTGEPMACRVTTCLACGSDQCLSNGLRRGQCGICLVGLLDSWGGNQRLCAYQGCSEQAVAYVDGANKRRCLLHLERGKWLGYVARHVLERDRSWQLTGAVEVPIKGQSNPTR
jgi:hypothetical protein